MQMLTATALSTAVALVLTTTMPSAGLNAASDIDSDIQDALASQPSVFIDTASIPEGQVDVSQGVITAPTSGLAEIEFSFALEDLEQVGVSVQSENEDFSLAVRDEGDGAFRALFHIPDESSPTEYRFEIDGDFELVPLEDGGITVRTADGELAGVISAPWASDANGAPVETDYVIEGNSVVQRVHTSSATAFPVVADPFWIPALLVMAHLTRHAITQAAARGVSQALIKQVVQNGVKSAGQKGTSVFTQGSGANRIRVIVDNKTGNIITVTKG
ncbi:DUF4258 domain-containing protein [Microbacterium sp. 179-I 3D2 NHS]|uniref:DUF4258 domain-containing protein n=1 Tax=Microbacterium sp. 179-I 3D2 NHS TaxID=3235178 RepID=UPI0039A2EE16